MKIRNQMMNEEVGGIPSGGGSVPPSPAPVDEAPDDWASEFEDLASEFDEDPFEGESLPDDSTPAPVVPEDVTPEVAPVPTPAPAPAVVEPVVTPTPAVPPVAPVAAPQPTPAPQPSPAPVVSREDSIKGLTKLFEIQNEDDVELLRTEPEKVLPRLLAQVFYDAHETALRNMEARLPTQLTSHYSRTVAAREAEEAFYTQWPQLKGHAQTVTEVAKSYRAANPTASREQCIAEIGALAALRAKVPLEVVPPQTAPAAEQSLQPTHYRPAVTSNAAPSNVRPVSVFEELADEFLRDDQE